MLVRSLLLIAVLPAGAIAQAFEYAPGTSQYRITQTSKVTQEMMGQKQGGETSVNKGVTVTLSRASKDTVAGVLVLDSISSTNTMGMPSPSLAHLLGLKVNTRVSPNGATVYSVEGPKEEDVPMASQLTLGMGQFLPRMRGKLAKGSTWTDTTSATVKQFGIDLNRKVVSSYSVVGDTSVAGEAGWKVAKADSTTLNGSGVGQMGAMTVEGGSASKSQFVVTSKGAFLGGDGNEDSNVRVVISANGAEISVTTSSTTKVQRVK
jgi:hypothetical protein